MTSLGLLGSIIGYFEYKKEARAEKIENKAKSIEEKARKDYKVAAEHAAGYARIRNDQKAQNAAKDAQDARAYNASLGSPHAQRLLR